ncbi:MAG: hypothetical protein HGGPFJEG_02790 [Ignavibacteria bacterium]|nr:hypothetical protein [Ignavibacteria bacterium]
MHFLKFLKSFSNADMHGAGPVMVYGFVYDSIGYNAINENLFNLLVINRLTYWAASSRQQSISAVILIYNKL